ncbi:MAG: hypothetical protein ABI644_07410, partial [Arenimonas sp.]
MTVSDIVWRSQRYGKILGDDFESLIHLFREMSLQAKELKLLLAKNERPEFWAQLAKGPSWAIYYQEPFEKLMARFVVMTQSTEVISALVAQQFPSDTARIKLEEHFADKVAPDDVQLLPMFLAMQGNVEAIARFSSTMNELLTRAQNEQFRNALHSR